MFKKALVFLHDLLASCAAWLLVVFVRFNFEIPPSEIYGTVVMALPLVLLVQSLMNVSFGLYKGIWRFASLQDILNIVKNVGMKVFDVSTNNSNGGSFKLMCCKDSSQHIVKDSVNKM